MKRLEYYACSKLLCDNACRQSSYSISFLDFISYCNQGILINYAIHNVYRSVIVALLYEASSWWPSKYDDDDDDMKWFHYNKYLAEIQV